MSRKATRRAERAVSLRRRLLAGATSVIMGLGLAVGGLSPAMAANPHNSLPAPEVGTEQGVTDYNQNGLGCSSNVLGFEKPAAIDGSNLNSDGLYQSVVPNEWGTLEWDVSEKRVSWTLADGWDVNICVKGGTYVSIIDTSEFDGTSYAFPHAGLSHLGFNIVEAPESTPTQDVTCELVTYSKAAPLSNGDQFVITITPPGGQITAQIDLNVAGGYNGLGLKITAFGVEQPAIPLTQEQVESGEISIPYADYVTTATWTVSFVQTNSIDTWPNLVCGELPDLNLVEPNAQFSQLGCTSDGSYTLDDVQIDGERAVQWYVFVGDTKPTELSGYTEVGPGTVIVDSAQTVHVKAMPISDEFGLEPGATSEWTFEFERPSDCSVVTECIPDEFISYTYIRSGSDANTGVVTVTQPAGDEYSDQLCKPLFVTAAAWTYDFIDSKWTQTLVAAKQINDGQSITEVGTYAYGVPVGCGQGDIYASRDAFPRPSPFLLGPNQPDWGNEEPWVFTEVFLSDKKKFAFVGPSPTWVQTNPGCNGVEPVDPTVTAIDECGTYGALAVSPSPFVSYVVKDAAGEVVAVVEFDESVDEITVPGAVEGEFTIVPVAAFPYLLQNYDPADDQWSVNLGEYRECPPKLEPEPVITLGNCFDPENSYKLADVSGIQWSVDGNPVDPGTYVLEAGDYNSEGVLTVEITAEIDESAEGGPYEFADGATRSWTQEFTEVTEADCVLPITDVTLAFNAPTCDNPQSLNMEGFTFDAELAELDGAPIVDSDGEYTVVFTAIGEKTVFFQSSEPIDGRQVSDDGKTLTLTGMLDGPNEELCEVLEVVDPFDYVDTCLTASYTLFSAEGLRYMVTVNSEDPFEVTFGEGEASKTFAASPGDYVLATPVAEPGYVLSPDQPAPLDRTFATYPNGCQLPEFPNWPASATATDEVCTPFGVTSGSITVELSVGPSTNPTPVRYYIAYETAAEQELTSATTTVPAGNHVVTAVLTDPDDSLNDAGNEPVDFVLTVGAAGESDCDLPTLAFTGASNAITGVGIGAVLIILAGLGFVLRRQLLA